MTHFTPNIKLCRLTAFALGFSILGVAAAGAFGVVWLRQDSAARAQATANLEQEIKHAERQNSALDARIAKAHSPQFLATRVPADLRPTNANQIVWMPRAQPLTPTDYTDPTLPAATKPLRAPDPGAVPAPTNAPTAVAAAEPSYEESPRLITFDLALINQQRSSGANTP
ncbi:MAG: hypothetical protein ACQKBV_03460 [Puniceicoccales bacterium]